MSEVLEGRHWVAEDPQTVWNAYVTPELFQRFFAPDGLSIPLESVVTDPIVLEAFRSSYCKLGRLLGVPTENR